MDFQSVTKQPSNMFTRKNRLVLVSVLLFIGLGLAFRLWSEDAPSSDQPRAYQGEQELLQYAFTGSLLSGDQLLPKIESLDGIKAANQSILLPVERFYNAYQSLEIISTAFIQMNEHAEAILKVEYVIEEQIRWAYAYASDTQGTHPTAAVVIPGSGQNQSSAIHRGEKENYHFGIISALGDAVDRFTLIKPNQDNLAFHNGVKKLNDEFIVNWQLEQGGSYSVSYIVDSLAITKYLQSQYDQVVVAGLSQGGGAALLNTLQSQPSAAIVASGFSIIDAQAKWSGHNQIIIPALSGRLSYDTMKQTIESSKTKFLFTYGKAEVGTFRIEAFENRTCAFLRLVSNVHCLYHAGGHVFPVTEMKSFLQSLDFNQL